MLRTTCSAGEWDRALIWKRLHYCVRKLEMSKELKLDLQNVENYEKARFFSMDLHAIVVSSTSIMLLRYCCFSLCSTYMYITLLCMYTANVQLEHSKSRKCLYLLNYYLVYYSYV